MRKRLFVLSVFLLFIAAACVAPQRRVRPDPSNPVYTVAFLPMYNATNDVDGPRTVREAFFKRLDNMNYQPKPLSEVDQTLMDRMGITLGSQLELTSPKELGETLGVDGVIYGYLLNFDDVTTGLYNMKKVRAAFKLVDTRTGRVVWARGLGVKSALAGGDVGVGVTLLKEIKGDGLEGFKDIKGLSEVPGLTDWQILRAGKTEKVEDAAMIAIGEKLFSKALGMHLKFETDEMIDKLRASFPAGPGTASRGEPAVADEARPRYRDPAPPPPGRPLPPPWR
ncbi:MAG: DUF799 family lipoprotein [Deltaproteobacteria bacterium]|nr:DUF799 family lipoprotein [Deltaproteobacteria bacterium]